LELFIVFDWDSNAVVDIRNFVRLHDAAELARQGHGSGVRVRGNWLPFALTK
jgi:hypothetical protein